MVDECNGWVERVTDSCGLDPFGETPRLDVAKALAVELNRFQHVVEQLAKEQGHLIQFGLKGIVLVATTFSITFV